MSQGYAAETLTLEGGFGLDPFLARKGEYYTGILNGADYSVWDPSSDQLLPANFSRDNLKGKAVCKKILQQLLGLKVDRHVPVIGIIGRFVQQKGFYMLTECIEGILYNFDVQFAILGSGDSHLENFFSDLHERYAEKLGLRTGFSNELAHLIEAGSDFFLMPSLYEPCGLNQIYSLRYGTLPIVRATGGLNDTVDNYDRYTGEGTGFKFLEASAGAIYGEVTRALDTFANRKEHIGKLIHNAMNKDFSWSKSADEYVRLYFRALDKKDTGRQVF